MSAAWSAAERALVDHLRALGHRVEPGEENVNRRSFDAYVDGVPTEFKTPRPGADSHRLVNIARMSKRDGGQARSLIFDGRESGLTESEAHRGVRRIRGAYSTSYDLVRVVGAGFDFTEAI